MLKTDRIFIVITLCILSSLGALAQRKAPGYMGRRFLLKYDQGLNWNLGVNTRARPNLFFTGQADYAISKRTSLGVEYSYMQRIGDIPMEEFEYFYDHDFSNYRHAEYTFQRNSLHKIGVYTKLFSQRNGHIAPAGPYLTVGCHLHVNQAMYRRKIKGLDVNDNSYVITSDQVKRVYFDVAPFLGGGKQYIVGNRIVLDLSMRVSVPLVGLFGGIFESLAAAANNHESTFEQRENRLMRRETMLNNASANFFEVRLGFGGLLF